MKILSFLRQDFVLICCFFCLTLFSTHAFAQTAGNADICTQIQCVKIQNGYLNVLSSDNATYVPYFIRGAAYQPTPIGRYPSDWGYPATDPRSVSANPNIYDDPNILTRDFSLFQQMNANTVRIYQANDMKISCPCTNNGRFTSYMTDANNTANTNTSLNTLDLAASYGLKVIAGFSIGTLTFDANNNIGSTDANGNPLTAQDMVNNFVTFVNNFKADRAILFWAIGNENNLQVPQMTAPQLTAWYALVNNMAQAAHNAEGAYFHPVAVVNGDIAEVGNSADGATDAQLPFLDIWGTNVYRGESFGTLFSNYAAQSSKPLWIAEFGVDAYFTTSTTANGGINSWGDTLQDDLGGAGYADPTDQSNWDVSLWNQIIANSPVAIGGTVFEYSDEWWKPYEFACTSPTATSNENTITAGICNSNQKYFGFADTWSPDDFSNEEWFGIVSIGLNPVPGDADVMTPRAVYYSLQSQWQANPNPWPSMTLNITGSGTGSISSTSTLGAGLNCNYSSSTSTGICSSVFAINKPVTLSFNSGNNSTVTNWGISSCSGNTCTFTPDANINLNITVSASSLPVVAITSPASGTYYYAGNNSITITATASSSLGPIKSVSFYESGSGDNNVPVLLGTATSGPYTYQWNALLMGDYSLTAVATDSTGATSTSAAIQIATSPIIFSGNLSTDNTSYTAPANVVLNLADVWVAYNPFGIGPSDSIADVAFYNGTTLLGTVSSSPYTFTWKNVPAGTYHLTAVATDIHGAFDTFSTAPITVIPNPGPKISITSPVNNASYTQGSGITLTANASSPAGIEYVQYFSGSTWIGGASLSSSPYTFTWNYVNAGTYTITAIATDNSGLQTTSSPVTVTVTAPTSPRVAITSPVNGAYVVPGANNVKITATASSSKGTIKSVSFYAGNVNGAPDALLATATKSPYTYQWNNVPPSTYYLTAVATDSTGAQSTSAAILFASTGIIWTGNLTTDSGSYMAPANIVMTLANLTVSNHYPNNTDEISKVAFYSGTKLLRTVASSPYTFTWKNVPQGTYDLTAVAVDSNGVKDTFSAAPITVN